MAAFVESGRLAYRGGYYMMPGSEPVLTEPQRAFFKAAVPIDPQRPHLPVSYERVTAEMKFARIAGLHHAFESLLATGAFIQVGGDLYHVEQVRAIQRLLEEALRGGNGITPAQFRDLVKTSRKHAVPLLEWFDQAKVTIRSGDVRVLVCRPG